MKTVENTCCKRSEHSPPLLRRGVGAASGVGAPTFFPTQWLDRWHRAGGGWAAGHLIFPNGENEMLRRLSAELNPDQRAARAEHLTKENADEYEQR